MTLLTEGRYSMTKDRVMRQLQERMLESAHKQARFCPQPSQFYIVKIRDVRGSATQQIPEGEVSIDTCISSFHDWQRAFSETWHHGHEKQSILNCVLHCTRPPHVSGRLDYLPFASRKETLAVFDTLRLPSSYFQIASGTAGSTQAQVFRDHKQPTRFEFIAHCLSKQGDWAIALSHTSAKQVTSVFWSVDERIESEPLLNDFHTFQNYALHPMLIPCIMFAANLRMSEQRRRTIKDTLQTLETAIRHLSQREAASYDRDDKAFDHYEQPQSLEIYFQMLHRCRKDQSSRKGRYGFWLSFVEAVEEGFQYVEELMVDAPDAYLLEANQELKRWLTVNDRILKSLMARDEDHVYRVDNVSHMLYSLVEQRDLRVQSSIARAAQRDSEDMKFIAVLGSIFLPASLVATILNVPEFQFALGTTLFGAYLGITIPLIGLVVVLCFARPHLKHWARNSLRRVKHRSELHPQRTNTVVSTMTD